MGKEDVAIIFNNKTITYEQLKVQVLYCIGELKKRKIVNGVVGIMLSRSPEYIYWVMAVLISGYAFVPVNVHADEEKRKYISANSNMDFCIVDSDYKNINSFEQEKFDFELPDLDIDKILSNESKLAYIMYTSGTTGLPKGVMISRGAFKNFIKNFLKNEIKRGAFKNFIKNFLKNEIKRNDIILANTTFTFDISLLEIVQLYF